MIINKTIQVRQTVYRWLYERRIEDPNIYFSQAEIKDIAAEPYLSAALTFGLDLGHLEKKRGHFCLTAQGMIYFEKEFKELKND